MLYDKKRILYWVWWHTRVVPVTLEAEVERVQVQAHPGQLSKTLSQNKKKIKRIGYVVFGLITSTTQPPNILYCLSVSLSLSLCLCFCLSLTHTHTHTLIYKLLIKLACFRYLTIVTLNKVHEQKFMKQNLTFKWYSLISSLIYYYSLKKDMAH